MKLDVNGHPIIAMGDSLICAETGKTFIAARDGCSVNYAWSYPGNEILSDEGVNIRELRAWSDRTKPVLVYIASDGKSVTGWKGNVLGRCVMGNAIRLTRWSYMHGKYIHAVRVTDPLGGHWYGRGSPGIACMLRACK